MSHVSVQCPDCRRMFVVSGRGRCRCGSYLIDHIGRGAWKIIDPTDPRPVWIVSTSPPTRLSPERTPITDDPT